jgi:predicted transport protein
VNVKALGDDVRFKVKEEYNAYRVNHSFSLSLKVHKISAMAFGWFSFLILRNN